MVDYLFYRLFGWLAPRIPAWLGYWLFARIGDLLYWLDAGGRRAVQDNLRHVLGPDEPGSVLTNKVRTAFHMQAYNYFDMFRLPGISPLEIEGRVHIQGWDRLEAAVARGKGAILVSAHFGNIDVLMQVLGLRGLKATVVVEHLQPERLFRYVADIRGHYGTKIIPVDASLKGIFRALRAGEIVALALDRDVTHSGIDIEFFGAPARLPDGYARVARHTGSPIILAFGLRLPDHQLLARLEPALDVLHTDDRAGDVRSIMRQVLDIAEKHIREHPEQWVMFRPIWQLESQG